MTILNHPSALELSGNLTRFRISSAEAFTFVLKKGSEVLLSQVYNPGTTGIVEIDVREAVESKLSYLFQDASTIYEQTNLVGTFTATIDATVITFTAIRSGVDRFADSATNFLTANFLTWQPQIKHITYYSPEFLTYYSPAGGVVKLVAHYSDDTTEVLTLGSLAAEKAYTIPLQYATINALLTKKLPSYYDVYVTNAGGDRLSYIQRFAASNIKSEDERWFLFENSLGGLDTIRAYGADGFTGEHTHNIADIDEVAEEYRVDTSRIYSKNTGYLDDYERRWLLDFFPSKKKFVYTQSAVRQIVVTESDVDYNSKDLPSAYSFKYRFSEAKPYLNLSRVDEIPDEITLYTPDVGSFTLPLRLNDLPHIELTEGALIPGQNPYSEHAGVFSVAELIAYLKSSEQLDAAFVKRSATGATIEGNGKTFGIEVDADGNLRFLGNIYASGSVSAQGVGTGGGGTSYNRLDTWAAYIPGTTDTWVLSALLGHDLHTRVTALEEDTPNVVWGVPTTDYVPLTVNAISRQLSVHGHGHTFASLASKPTTIAGYGITDSLIYEGDARLTNSRPASDVQPWAKAATKPSYSYTEVGAAAASHYHDDRYFKKDELFTKEGSGTEADPYRIKANFPFYGVSSVAALGIGTSGGGVAYDRLDDWMDYTAEKAGWVLSALLGADLHSRVGTLEASTPNIAFGVPTTQYVALTVNSTTRSLSVDGHTHTKAGITDFAHTHGNITNGGYIGSTANRPIITGTGGILQAGSFGSAANTFCQGNDSRLSDARPASDVSAWAKAASKPTYNTSEVSENTNLYFTTARVLATTLGAITASNLALQEGITLSVAMSRIQGQINARALLAGSTSQDFSAKALTLAGAITGATSGAFTTHIDIGNARIMWDSANNSIKVINKNLTDTVNFYATGSNSALGVGVGGGGTAYDRLDTWASFDITKAGWVLSAALGYDLHGRVSTLESSTPNIAWGVAGSGYIPLAVNGASHQLSTHGHTHTKSSITDFAHTHDDRYYTETEVGNLFAGTTAISGYNKSNWDGVYTAFNAMQVGGKDLARGTGLPNLTEVYFSRTGWGGEASVDTINNGLVFTAINGWHSYYIVRPDLAGQKITISVKLKQVAGTAFITFGTGPNIMSGNSINSVSELTPIKTTVTCHVSGMIGFTVRELDNSGNTTSWLLKEIKIEIGNVATDWTPAPEDVDASIATVQTNLTTHTALTNNPHGVTASQLGLGSVNNTADSEKNVLSATKLTTARTLWGQSFDGTANVTGAMSATTAILSNLTANKIPYHTATGLTDSPIVVSGNDVSTAGNLTLSSADGSYLQVGWGRLVWDNTNNALKVIKADGTAANFYATGSNTALGIGTGGGGSSYNMVSDWSQYVAGSELWVVSAELINSLRTSVTALEEDTPNIAWGVAGSGYIPLAVNGVSHQLSTYGHTHTKSNITDFAHTHTKSQVTDFPTTLSAFTNDLGNYGGFLTGITKAQVEAVLTGGITSHTHGYALLAGASTQDFATKNLIVYGEATIGYGYDFRLKANTTNPSDPGDIVWLNNSNAELHRLWAGTGTLYYRANAGTTYGLYHAGNINLSTIDFATKNLTVAGAATFSSTVSATGYLKSSSSDSYVLLGGGGHIALTDLKYQSGVSDIHAIPNDLYTFFSSGVYPINGPTTNPWQNGIQLSMAGNGDYRIVLCDGGDGNFYRAGQSGGIWSGWSLMYSSTNSNLSTVDWNANNVIAAGYITAVGEIDITSANPFLYLWNNTPTTGKIWQLNSKANGSFTIGIQGNTQALVFDNVEATFASTVSSNGFLKAGSSDSYVLLGGGGHKAVEDFVHGDNGTRTKTASYGLNDYFPSGFYYNNSKFLIHSSYTSGGNVAGLSIYANDSTNGDLYFLVQDGGGGGVSRTVMHSGNSNLTTIDWSAKNLTVAGTASVTGLLTATGNIATANVDGAYLQLGPIKILYDATNGAIRVEGNIYATGSNTAFGVGGGAGGGGLITKVYGSAGFGGTYSDVDLSSTFNAYAINSLYTALQGKQDTITGAISTLVSSNLYANYALVSGATGKIQASGVTATELSYLSGVTSAVQYQIGSLQAQINAKPSINSYPTAFSWNAGSTSGPTGTLSGSNMTAVSFGAIPAASLTASGIVTTGEQYFAGEKSFGDRAIFWDHLYMRPVNPNRLDAFEIDHLDYSYCDRSIWVHDGDVDLFTVDRYGATTGYSFKSSLFEIEANGRLKLNGTTSIYSVSQVEPIITFDGTEAEAIHHWASAFEGAVSTGPLTASTISTGDVAFKVQKLTRQLSPSDISNGMYQFSGAHANPSKVVFMGCQVYQASNGSLYGDTLSGDGEYFLHPVAAYNNNINVYFESADNSLSPDDTIVLFLIYTL